jgi:hypothetical protein
MTRRPRRPASGWERGLIGLPAPAYALLGAVLLGVAAVAAIATFGPARLPALAELKGHVRRATEQHGDSWWLQLELVEQPFRFCRQFPRKSPRLLRAVESGQLPGASVVLEVDATELSRARAEPGRCNLMLVSLRTAQATLASRAEYLAGQQGNRVAGRWVAALLTPPGLLMVWFALRRRRLLGAAAAPRRAALQAASLLARKPPHRLRPRFALGQSVALLVGIAFCALGAAGLTALALHDASELQKDTAAWERGVRGRARLTALAERGGVGGVRSQRVRLDIVEPAAARRSVELELPWGKSELPAHVEARWRPNEPQRVVIPQLAERSQRRLGWVSFCVLAGVLCAIAAIVSTVQVRARIDAVQELAQAGRLVAAELVSLEVMHGQMPMRRVVYRLPSGELGREQYMLALPGPLFADAQRVVVLCSHDGRRHAMLREDGFPLAL